jgi:NhaP-type Na+/H+ or K+/H+ antiporter
MLFVLVGASVDLSYSTGVGPIAFAMLGIALVLRLVGVTLALIGTHLSEKEKIFCIISYIPKATVQAAIGAIPLAAGVPSGNLILTMAVLAIFVTAPLGALGIDLSYKKLLSPPTAKADSE